ncbi:hypothetical protein ACJJTC_015470 [Scirpophaga incertulas]
MFEVVNMENSNSLSDVPVIAFPDEDRINNLINLFYDEYNIKPQFIVKVPGRVNIIGEHIDYCGYPVLPLALEQDILIAGNVINELELWVQNSDKKKYNKYYTVLKTFQDVKIEPDTFGKPYWYNYVLCGIKGALEYLNNDFFYGLQLFVDGNIPPASGLSSSSALVSAACLAFLYAQNASLNKTKIASMCAKCERYIGTEGGGMDQAIAFLAEKYCAQYITFNPLQAQPVSLPEDAIFVVAHSIAEANKAATNDFNKRVIECRLAAKLLATTRAEFQDKKILTLNEVQNLLGQGLEEMIALVKKVLTKHIYGKNEICDLLMITEADLNEIYLTPNTRDITEFKLRQRALHVYEEARRVELFRKICQTFMNLSENNSCEQNVEVVSYSNGDINKLNYLTRLGELMSESHQSLKICMNALMIIWTG